MKTPSLVLKLTANLMAELIFKPSGPVRPSKKTVMDRTMKDTGFDREGFERWTKEEIPLKNDGILIPADYYPIPDAKGVAILAHGYGQNRYVLIPQAEILRDLGYSLILFDQRHFGESKAKNGTFGVREATDLVALAKWAKRKCGKDVRIITLGVSMGAMTVMNAISKTDLIDAAIEDCGPSRWDLIYKTFFEVSMGMHNPYFQAAVEKRAAKYGISLSETRPVDSVAKSDTALLVIHSEGDRTVPVSAASEIIAASKNPLSRMQIFGNYDHAFSINDRELYRSAVTAFLNDVFEEGEK